MFRRKHNQLLASSALIAFSLTLSLGLGEWILSSHYHFPKALAPHPPFGDILPGARIHLAQKDFEIDLNFNSEGFRGPDFETLLAEGEIILFLGDSFVEGFGVDENQRASNLVENLLREQPASQNIRIVNAGQTMTGPPAYFFNLIRFGLAFNPRAVVVGLFMGNDFIGARHHPVPNGYKVRKTLPVDLNPKMEDRPWRLGFLRTLLATGLKGGTTLQPRVNTNKYWEFFYGRPINRNFYFQESGLSREAFERHLERIPVNIREDFFSGKINPSYLVGSFTSGGPSSTDAFSDDDIRNTFDTLYEMYFVCSQRKIPFLLVLYPSPYQVFPEQYASHLKQNLGYIAIPQSLQELKGIRQSLIRWLENDGIPFVDLAPHLNANDFYLFDGHLNVSGQAKTAFLIYKELATLIQASS